MSGAPTTAPAAVIELDSVNFFPWSALGCNVGISLVGVLIFVLIAVLIDFRWIKVNKDTKKLIRRSINPGRSWKGLFLLFIQTVVASVTFGLFAYRGNFYHFPLPKAVVAAEIVLSFYSAGLLTLKVVQENNPARLAIRPSSISVIFGCLSMFIAAVSQFASDSNVAFSGQRLSFSYLLVVSIYEVFKDLDIYWLRHRLVDTIQIQLLYMVIESSVAICIFAGSVFIAETVGGGGENPYWNPAEDFHPAQQGWSVGSSLYFVLVTISTVGYGDLSASSPVGRLVVCGIIVGGIVFFGYQTSRLLDVARQERRGEAGYHFRPDRPFVIVTGDMSLPGLDDFLQEFLFGQTPKSNAISTQPYQRENGSQDEDHSYKGNDPIAKEYLFGLDEHGNRNEIQVVVLASRSTWKQDHRDYLEATYETSVVYLAGDVMDPKDLFRVKVDHAEAVFVLSKVTTDGKTADGSAQSSIDDSDETTVMRCLTLLKRSPHVKIYIMLNQSKNIPHLVSAGIDNNSIACMDELRYGILAQNTITPGTNAFYLSLIRSTDFSVFTRARKLKKAKKFQKRRILRKPKSIPKRSASEGEYRKNNEDAPDEVAPNFAFTRPISTPLMKRGTNVVASSQDRYFEESNSFVSWTELFGLSSTMRIFQFDFAAEDIGKSLPQIARTWFQDYHVVLVGVAVHFRRRSRFANLRTGEITGAGVWPSTPTSSFDNDNEVFPRIPVISGQGDVKEIKLCDELHVVGPLDEAIVIGSPSDVDAIIKQFKHSVGRKCELAAARAKVVQKSRNFASAVKGVSISVLKNLQLVDQEAFERKKNQLQACLALQERAGRLYHVTLPDVSTGQIPRPVDLAELAPPSDLSGHIILAFQRASTEVGQSIRIRGIEHFLRPLSRNLHRGGRCGFHRGHGADKALPLEYPVVIMMGRQPEDRDWDKMRRYAPVYLVIGFPTSATDLMRVGLPTARALIVLGKVDDEPGLEANLGQAYDNSAILSTILVEGSFVFSNPNLVYRTVTELNQASNIRFLKDPGVLVKSIREGVEEVDNYRHSSESTNIHNHHHIRFREGSHMIEAINRETDLLEEASEPKREDDTPSNEDKEGEDFGNSNGGGDGLDPDQVEQENDHLKEAGFSREQRHLWHRTQVTHEGFRLGESERFACGRIFPSSAMNSILAQAYHNSSTISVIRQMLRDSNFYITTRPVVLPSGATRASYGVVVETMEWKFPPVGLILAPRPGDNVLPVTLVNPIKETIVTREDLLLVYVKRTQERVASVRTFDIGLSSSSMARLERMMPKVQDGENEEE